MKPFIITSIMLIITGTLNAQLQVNAGNDTVICVGLQGVDTTRIGGHPTVSGGVEPYRYTWSAKYSIGSNTYHASNYLNDTNLANPHIINDPVGKQLNFHLKVTDYNDQQGFDSIVVRFSRYMYTLEDYMANINAGDTIMLGNNIDGGIEPLRFAWYPNYNISDTTIHNPMAWPDINIDYKVYAIDSVGCKSATDIFEVTVNPVDIEIPKSDKALSIVSPNPIDGSSIISLRTNIESALQITIINDKGQFIWRDDLRNSSYPIGQIIQSKGLFRYFITDGQEIISYGQFTSH
ncbi:MAG: hypothetical protein GVY19_03670 [Bacteroidetes bacterium]|jgi:hypothetical protein|nr:hypothetical protein [Bacteroidota bacterium]